MAAAETVEVFNLLVDKCTASKLKHDPNYLQQYLENLKKTGFVLKHSTESNEAVLSTALLIGSTTQQINRSEGSASIDQENVQENLNQNEALELNAAMTVSEKEQDSQGSQDIGSRDRAPVLVSFKVEQTAESLQNSGENGSSVTTLSNSEDQSTGSAQNSGESSNSNNTSNTPEWNIAATRLLISTRLKMENDFQKPVKKSKLWTKISKIMKERGHAFGATECHTKWRNMMGTYRKIVERSKICSPRSIRWEYYNQFNEVYGSRANTAPPEIIYVRPMSQNFSTYSDIEQPIPPKQIPLPHQFTKPEKERPLLLQEASIQTPLLKRKRNYDEFPPWFSAYLEKREKDNQKKIELKKQRWQHIREIESKKIETMKKLTTVLKQFLEK